LLRLRLEWKAAIYCCTAATTYGRDGLGLADESLIRNDHANHPRPPTALRQCYRSAPVYASAAMVPEFVRSVAGLSVASDPGFEAACWLRRQSGPLPGRRVVRECEKDRA